MKNKILTLQTAYKLQNCSCSITSYGSCAGNFKVSESSSQSHARGMARNAQSKPKYTIETLHEICGSLLRIPRLERIKSVEWLSANYQYFDARLLRMHYGLFLSLLRKAVPVKPMVEFLLPLTDSSTITQSRVNVVCQIFTSKMNSPSIGRLLRVMSERCKPGIYVPPLGQPSVENAFVPIDIRACLAWDTQNDDLLPPECTDLQAAKICTKIYQSLLNLSSDVELAEALAQLVPLVEQAGRVPSCIEKFVYGYLDSAWQAKYKSQKTLVLTVVASSFFRFWPKTNERILEERLFLPLMSAQKSAIDILVPNLWHFGHLASPLMNVLVINGRPDINSWYKPRVESFYMHIFDFYKGLEEPAHELPPEIIVADLIIRLKVYLAPCMRWCRLVPAICVTLQGQFCLFSNDESLGITDRFFTGEDSAKTLFALANSPWLGGYPQRTFSRVKVQNSVKHGPQLSSKRPASSVVVIDPLTLESLVGMNYPDFCQQLLSDLHHAGLNIAPYLEEIDA